ncbi:MAG TPA: L-fucose:H+ symporter permease [Chitinophagaceae bacterium]|nr:L-fucose:H+ symporter permease [Chitinophagaceae bacterium]
MSKNRFLLPFILVCSLFFLWAFLHNLNPILIPHLKKACQLTDTQSSFIDSAIYLAYFTIAIPAGLFIHKYSYKKGILFGLSLYALGALLFIPAAATREYAFFLFALFVSASGATFLETVANPYVTVLGRPETSEQRLNFAQSFNGLGAAVAPLIGGKVILSGIEHTKEELAKMSPAELTAYLNSEASTIKLPYLVMAAVVLAVAVMFVFTKMPEVTTGGHTSKFSMNVFKFSHLKWAVIAEFCYVGAQVGVGSFIVRYSKFVDHLGEKQASDFWAYAMIGFMAGRFAGTFLMKYIKPAKLLSLYAFINIALLTVALTTKGMIAVYAVLVVPFFMSIMFPTIFALGIKDLGEEAKIGSSFLVMSIIGGGIIPIIMGIISDKTGSMQIAYIVPLVCFVVILFFGLRGYKIKNTAVYNEVEESPVVV